MEARFENQEIRTARDRLHDLRLFHEKKMVLIMSLPANSPEMCAAAFEAGADVVKCHVNLHHHASGGLFGSLDASWDVLETMLSSRKGPMGLVLGADVNDVERDMEKAMKLPFSFYSLYAHHVPPCLSTGPVPIMAAADSTYTLEEIRRMPACGASILEASIVPGDEYGTRLSMRDLLKYRMICENVDVPVVVPTQRRILPSDVPSLHACGISGLMIGAIVTGRETRSVVEAVHAFRNAIDALA